MGKTAKDHLNGLLTLHLNTIHETFQVLDQTPSSGLEKVTWDAVIQMGDQLSKHATLVGMLWTDETPKVEELEESMTSYFNMLQGFLLLTHGSRVGAGPTLSSCVHASVKKVVDCSFVLMKESVSSYGSLSKNMTNLIPQLVGTVWDACSGLKKTPSTNITAIGRAMTQVAVQMKDVLREMKELKPASSDPLYEEGSSVKAECMPHDNDNDNDNDGDDDDDGNSSEGDIGNDLSPYEMRTASLAISVVSETLVVIKELIRTITGFLKQEKANDNISTFVDSLERLLKLCQEIGVQVDEIGACLYPPQEISAMKTACDKISSNVDEMEVQLESLGGNTESFLKACANMKISMRKLVSDLSCSGDVVPKMQNLDVNN